MNANRWSLIFVLFLGMGFALPHAPYNWPVLGFIAIGAAANFAKYTARKLWAGYLFGLGFFGLTMSWIAEPFAVGPPEYAWMGYPAWALMAAGLALFWIPIFAFVTRGVWSVALIFGVMEYLRGHIFTGLPWALMAYGWQDVPQISQGAALIGAYGLSAFLALSAVLMLDFPNWRNVILGALLLCMLPIYSYLRAPADDMSVALLEARAVQPNFTMEERWNTSPIVQLRRLVGLSQGDADLVVWPEGSILVSPTRDANLLAYIHQALREKTVILGAPSYDEDLYFNSAYEIRPDGEIYRYDKQHLVPFGEYIPFGDWLLAHGIATQTVTTFSARKGKAHPYPEWDGPRPNILICYEGIFPAMSRREGDYIVLITNDIWFGARSGPYHHLAAARFRAIENGQPLIRSALTGISAIINADGDVLEALPLDQEGYVEAELGAKYQSTFYRRWGDWPFWVASLLGFVILILKIRRSRPSAL